MTEFIQHQVSGLELLVVSPPGAYGFMPKDKRIGYTILSVLWRVVLRLKCFSLCEVTHDSH